MMIETKEVLISEINMDNSFNCRGELPAIEVAELAKDLEKEGQLQPVIIMTYATPKDGFKYLLLIGYRRTTAAKVLRWDRIRAEIRPEMSEADARYMNLRENVHRKELTVLQEAQAISKLKDLGIGRQATANHLGKSTGWVQVRYLLLELPQEVQKEVAAGLINQRHIRELHQIMGRQGQAATFEAVRGIKDAKIRGQKAITVNPNRDDPDRKIHRGRKEIFGMMEHVENNVGNGLATRCMAWCGGEITSNELFESLKAEAGDNYRDIS